jgi:hypothetical protein
MSESSTETTEEEVKEITQNIRARDTWVRGLFMLLFVVLYEVAEWVLFVLALLQFLWTLFTRRPNQRLVEFGEGLGRYAYQIVRFLTFNTEDKPFPFADWPGAAPASPTPPAKPRGRRAKGAKES